MLTPDEELRTIHRWRNWHLLSVNGEPMVLKVWKEKRTVAGKIVDETMREWGKLDSPLLTDEAKRQLTDAWAEWSAWIKANTP